MGRFIILIVWLLHPLWLVSQPHKPQFVSGKVIDQNTNQPVEHARIYFSSVPSVFFTDHYGKFHFPADKLTPNDTIYISSNGYSTQKFTFAHYHRFAPLIVKLTQQQSPIYFPRIRTVPLPPVRSFYLSKKQIQKLHAPRYNRQVYPQSTIIDLITSLQRCLIAGNTNYIMSYLLAFEKKQPLRTILNNKQLETVKLTDSLYHYISFAFNTLSQQRIKQTKKSTAYQIDLFGIPYTLVKDRYHQWRFLVPSSWIELKQQ